MGLSTKLSNTLVSIGFADRFSKISEAHSDRSSVMTKPDIDEVSTLITRLGYKCSYNKKHKFFKISGGSETALDVGLNFAVERGKAEFILNLRLDGKGDGGPFAFMCDLMGCADRIKNPVYRSYDELEVILKEGLEVYEDIKKGLAQEL